MATAFTGVSTGRVYNAGQLYANGNGLYRANADGSFSNLSTGRTAVGSYGSEKAVFFNAGGRRVGQPEVSSSGAGTRRAAGTGAGNAGVVSVAGVPTTVGPGTPRVAATALNRGAFLAGPGNSEIKVTPVFAFGRRVAFDGGWSDGEEGETRWGDFGGGIYGLGVMAADFTKGAYDASTLKGDKVVEDLSSAGWAIATGFVADRQRLRAEAAVADYAAHQRARQENTGYPGVPESRANPDPYFGATAWQPWTLGADGNKYRTGGGF